MDEQLRASEADVYAASLDFTLKELQRKLRDHQAELDRIRSSQGKPARLSAEDQAIVIKDAFESVNASAPFLPFAGSVLPALLALRRAHQTITESKAYLESHTEHERKQLEADRTSFRDHHLLTEALTSRIASLREEVRSKAEMRPEDSAREKMDELREKKKSYDKETRKLMATLRDFTDTQLAGMLAAEELGGPVVGDVMEVDPDELAAGFDAQGKMNKSGKNDSDRRQRRIDEIWGSRQQRARPDGDEEIATAGREMRELLEELLNRLGEAKGDNSASYVVLERESAAARFLVRSKVAQFHPKDANRLRLIDFGRDLDN
ncbi:hypothetical protein AAL_04237 [Moelleriella libera RCEF 2490]|uniref:Uncharacterized protein n=1 Tax=Moelleriella libera RCEF 2490 TaxID=1081109 RepID=A0A168BZB2_9HYPO|nr:hypothetical protein AAL_04237 [Moelleriella libera RCEF 2490]